MFGWLKNIIDKIQNINNSIDKYKEETVIQSLPSYTCVNRAKVLIEKHQFDEAEQILLKALELPQKDALVYKYLGVIYERTGKHAKSVEAYQTSADIEPQDKNIWQRLGFELITTGRYENAIKSFENANKIQPANTDTFTGWGMALMKLQRFDEAHAKFEDAIKSNKYNFTAVFLASVMEIKLKMYDKAEMKLSFLSNVCPDANNTFEYARLKALKDDLDSAIHYAKKSIGLNSKMLPAYIVLGQIYTDKFDYENAQKAFADAENNELINPALYLEWGKSYIKFDKLDEAKQKLLKAFELDNEAAEIQSYLALCLVLRNEMEEAKPFLDKISEENNSITKQVFAIVNYKNEDISLAMEFFRANDENAINNYFLAKCYEKLNNDTKVKDCYENAIRINPRYTKAFVDFANYLMSKNEFIEAQRKLRKALKYEPENILLLNLMFYVNYILVKDNLCEYNVKETVAVANKIEKINPEWFKYPEQKKELEKFLNQ